MDSSVSLEDRIWFLRVCHHVPFSLYCCQMFACSPGSRSQVSCTWPLDLPNDTTGYTRKQTACQAKRSLKVCVGCELKLIDVKRRIVGMKTGRSFIANQTQTIPLKWVTFTDSRHIKKRTHGQYLQNVHCPKYVASTYQ